MKMNPRKHGLLRRIFRMAILAAPVFLAAGGRAQEAPAPGAAGAAETAMRITTAPQLFVDGALAERLEGGARLELHAPVAREVALVHDAPWEGKESGYATVLRDGGLYRMYYRGGGELSQEVTCVAESEDGVHWTRPSLGLFEFKGSKENNIVWRAERPSYGESHNFTPFIDANPACPPEERYKAIGLTHYKDAAGENHPGLLALISPDGLHWRRASEEPFLRKGAFDSQNTAFWDAARGRYACYSRIGREGKRSIQLSVSTDFRQWSDPRPLDFGPAPLEHFYTNAICPYPRAPEMLIGLPMRFVPERRRLGAEGREVDGVSDGVLIASRDGLHFPRVFMEAFLRPGPDPENWGAAHGNNTPAFGIHETAPGEISLWWAEHYGTVPRMRRGTLRTDGFVSVRAPRAGGEIVTPPLVFTGRRLTLNYSTSAVGSVRVELQDAAGQPLPGFELHRCGEIFGDEFEREVAWEGAPDLAALAGRPARLRFVLSDADLYSFRVVE